MNSFDNFDDSFSMVPNRQFIVKNIKALECIKILIELRLIGYPSVWRDGEPITGFISEKVIALLVYLAVTQETHARDYLTGLLWGDTPEKKAKASLRSAIYNIGQVLPDVLTVTRKTVALAVTPQMDIKQLQEKDDPVGYEADFLAGFYITNAPEFETWQLRQREQLRILAVAAWERRAIAHETSGQRAEAIHAWNQLVHLEPWREKPHRHIMRINGRSGDFSAALQQYKQCQLLLADELDMEPSVETSALAEQIRQARSHPRHNLPVNDTPFFGRESLLSQIDTLMQRGRCVTLLGMGGMGKSRLAVAYGEQAQNRFLNGVAYVSLMGVSADGDARTALATAIVRTLTTAGMMTHSHDGAEQQLLSQLGSQEMLLILDNFEQLLNAASFLNDLLENLPQLRVLITSRERLRLKQEQVVWVEGMGEETAVSLFMAAAQRIHPDIQPDGAIKQICHLVGGMPLAIELAASWIDVQTPAQIAAELTTGLHSLADDAPNREERHRSINYLLDQAWQRLESAQQQILRRLTPFQGSFSGEAVTQIAYANRSDLRLLINRSLLQRFGSRFRLHPLLRQFLLEKEADDEALQACFSHYFLEKFTTVGKMAEQGADGETLATLLPDYKNFGAAWQWAVENEPLALETISAYLHILFADRGVDAWVHQLVSSALSQIPSAPEFERLQLRLQLEKAYLLFWHTKEYATAEALMQSSLVTLNSPPKNESYTTELAYCHTLLGWYHHYHAHDLDVAETHYQQAFKLWQRHNNLNYQASRLLDLGNIAFARQKLIEAENHWQQCAACAQKSGNDLAEACAEFSLGRLAVVQQHWLKAEEIFRSVQSVLSHHQGLNVEWHRVMGLLAVLNGNYGEADALFQAQLEICQQYGRVDHTIDAYCNNGRLAKLMGDGQKAERFFRQAAQLYQQQGIVSLKEKIAAARQKPAFVIDEV